MSGKDLLDLSVDKQVGSVFFLRHALILEKLAEHITVNNLNIMRRFSSPNFRTIKIFDKDSFESLDGIKEKFGRLNDITDIRAMENKSGNYITITI